MNLYYIVVALLILFIIFPTTKINLDINKYFNFGNKSKKITKSKLEKFSNNKTIFVAYTADWCPHCVEFKNKTYGKLVNYFRNHPNIEIRNVDCTNDNGKIRTEGGNRIDGFPTLVINKYGNSGMEETMYEGPRDADSIIKYLKNL